MILTIENLGVVKFAQIDLSKKLTLFCGRNSTGKTYVAYILQAFLSNDNAFPLKSLEAIGEEAKQTGGFMLKADYVQEWLDMKCDMIKSQLGTIFGISDKTVSSLFKDFSLSASLSHSDLCKMKDASVDISAKEGDFDWGITKQKGEEFLKVSSSGGGENKFTKGSIRFTILVSNCMRLLAFGRLANVRMLTVERNSIYTFKTELSLSLNELIDRIQQQSDRSEIDLLDIFNKSSRRYPQAVRSSLRIANDLDNVQKSESPYTSVADMLENDLLHGEVSMTRNGDVEFHAQSMPKTRRLPFHLSSSIVKTMASLVIYLRHIAQSGDTLIIDEPEMNFHPDVQVLLARLFAVLVSKGLKVIISTHSDYIVRELNNLIMAGAILRQGKALSLKDIGYSDDMTLNHEEMSVLLFEYKGKKNVRANAIPINEEGFEIASIDQTITEQNERAETLYDTLKFANE